MSPVSACKPHLAAAATQWVCNRMLPIGPAENDFVLAAKLDNLSKKGLLRGKKKYFKDV